MTPHGGPRIHIDHSGEGTVAELAQDDLDARVAVKALGFRWSRNLGAWFLPRPWSEATRRQRVTQLVDALGADAVVVDDQGRGALRSAAEREADAQERALDRAERMDARAEHAAAGSDAAATAAREMVQHIPFGQPILVGHHSEGRHRRDLARIEGADRRAHNLQQEAQASQAAANSARLAATGPTPLARQRRIERNEAELRKVQRTLAATSPASAHHAQLKATEAQLVDSIAHDKVQVAASGTRVFTSADIAKGDAVRYRNGWHRVVRVNKTTVSVATGYSWTDKVPMHQITDVRRACEVAS